ncbi:MAG: rod shape-determining protein MreD [Lachnospiraceae bacterium]|nr:rod shape-determining protein MreD [Lachnospiraceae bacterium]
MKKYIFAFITTIVMFLLQTTIFPRIAIKDVMPNLLLVCVTVFGFVYGRRLGMFTGVLCGILHDVMYSSVIGLVVILYVLIAYVNGSVIKQYFSKNYIILVVTFALSDLAFNLLYFITRFLLRGRIEFITFFVQIMLPEMIYTSIWGLIIFSIVSLIDKKIYPPREVFAKVGDVKIKSQIKE